VRYILFLISENGDTVVYFGELYNIFSERKFNSTIDSVQPIVRYDDFVLGVVPVFPI